MSEMDEALDTSSVRQASKNYADTLELSGKAREVVAEAFLTGALWAWSRITETIDTQKSVIRRSMRGRKEWKK